jgi:hypothetical protein
MIQFIGFLLAVSGAIILYSGLRWFLPSRARRRPERRRSRPKSIYPAKPAPVRNESGPFTRTKLGDRVRYRHPDKGEQTGKVIGYIQYTELWQRRKDPAEPWIPTGNTFQSVWLGDTLLYFWKGQLWIMDSYDSVSDTDIKRNFLPAAKRFGQSDETALVNFAYPPGSWEITDIGKFRVYGTAGEGLRLTQDALGRFIHARGGTGLEGRALVVEDYQEGHGGQDTVWLGWAADVSDVLEIIRD